MIKDFLLAEPVIYRFFIKLVGSGKARKNFVEKLGLKAGDKILDIGCGPADILEYLPETIEYIGFDSNKDYINVAKKRFKNRGKFYCEDVDNDLLKNNLIEKESFNLVSALGVLHHLTDEQAKTLFDLAENVLVKGGKIITRDGCYTENQPLIKKIILNMDRGKFVRTKEEYEKLATYRFNNIKSEILQNASNIPYTHIIMEGIKD